MNAILWIFVALAFALMAFVSIQDDMPEELSFLKSSGTPTAQVAGQQRKVTQLDGWTVKQQGPVVEATRRFSGELKVNGTPYDVPELGILCNTGKLDARLDTRMATTGTKTTRVEVDGHTSDWEKGNGKNIFPANPTEFVRYLAARPTVSMTISYVDLGKQTTLLETKQLSQLLAAMPASCK